MFPVLYLLAFGTLLKVLFEITRPKKNRQGGSDTFRAVLPIFLTPKHCKKRERQKYKNKKSAQRVSFWDGYPADIRGSFARISRPKNFGQGAHNPGKEAFGRGHP